MTHRPTILVTNDDGIDSPGLHAVVAAIAPMARVVVIAPDRNRSGVSRSITLGQTIIVEEREVPGADVAFATDGTPTDCVRLAVLELAGPRPDLVVSGANLGLNVGDDIAYSGTVSAALDAAFNGIPAIAVSQQSVSRELGYHGATEFKFEAMGRFLAPLAAQLLERHPELPDGLVVNVNVPGVAPDAIEGVEIGIPGKRIYRDRLDLRADEGAGRRRFSLYGDDPEHHADEAGTDIAAIGRNCIAVSPIRFAVADVETGAAMAGWDLGSAVRH